MNLAAAASLIVATSELKVVQLIRGAMQNADAAAGHGCAGLALGPASCGTIGCGPAATIEPRRTIHPTPRFTSRVVFHPTPRFEPRPIDRAQQAAPAGEVAPSEPETARVTPSPLSPPWAMPVWRMPIEATVAPRKLKAPAAAHDIHNRGVMLDLFI